MFLLLFSQDLDLLLETRIPHLTIAPEALVWGEKVFLLEDSPPHEIRKPGYEVYVETLPFRLFGSYTLPGLLGIKNRI